jgi:hypothetical protein
MLWTGRSANDRECAVRIPVLAFDPAADPEPGGEGETLFCAPEQPAKATAMAAAAAT